MAVTPVFTCICGVQKKTTNHWVLASVTPLGITFLPWDWKLAEWQGRHHCAVRRGVRRGPVEPLAGDWKQSEAELAVPA